VGLARDLGTRTRLDLSGGYARYFYEAEELADSEGLRATAELSRAVSSESSLRFSYGFQSNQYEGRDQSQTHTVSAGFGRTLSARTSMSVSVGADQRTVGGVPSRWIFAGGGAFNLRGNRTSLGLRFSRGITPGPGLGQDRILNLFSVVLTSTLRPWATLTLVGSRGLNQDPVDSDLNYSTDGVDLGLRLRLSQTLGLGPQFRYRRRGEFGATPPVDSFRVDVALSYSRLLR